MLRKNLIKRFFSEQTQVQIKKERLIPSNLEAINPYISRLTEKEINEIKQVGADIIIPREHLIQFQNSGLFHEENESFKNASKNLLLDNYLSRMNLYFDYQEVFRDFIQSIARNDLNFLNLVAEAYLSNYLISTLGKLKKIGYFIELESLRNKQEITPLSSEMFKNLRINRYKNLENLSKLEDLKINKGTLVNVANVEGTDSSIFDNNKPFILSTLVKVKTPMKLSIYNQNLSLKLYGKEVNEEVTYLVKYETELSHTEMFSIIYNPNKRKRTRQTRIVDINNILEGNPFKNPKIFEEVLSARKQYSSKI